MRSPSGCKDTEALVLIRERTQIRAPLLERLTSSSSSASAACIRTSTSTRARGAGVIVSSNQHPGTPSYAAAELTWGLMLAAMRQIPQQMAALKSGRWQIGVGDTPAREDAGDLRLRQDRRRRGGLRQGLRNERSRLGARGVARARAQATVTPTARSKRAFFEECDVLSLHLRLVDGDPGHRHGGRPGRDEADARYW